MDGQIMDKLAIKSALEEMIRERNPELQTFLEDILAKYLTASPISDRRFPLDMTVIRQKYSHHALLAFHGFRQQYSKF